MNLTAPIISNQEEHQEESADLATPRARAVARYAAIIVALFTVTLFISFVAYRAVRTSAGRVLGESAGAYQELASASGALSKWDIESALTGIERAHEHFAAIEDEARRYGPFLNVALAFSKKGQSYYHLAKTGLHGTKAAAILSRSEKSRDDTALSRIIDLQTLVEEAREPIMQAEEESRQIDPSYFTSPARERITELQRVLAFAARELDPMIERLKFVRVILGENWTRRYLFLFQNSGEIRPTGGFIGSLAIADVRDGKLNTFFVPSGGSYDLRYGLTKRLRSPRPFSILNPEWQVQDCNWFPDFRASAKKCAWFTESSFGSSFDGVVAINDKFMVEVLRAVGPITLSEYGTIITSENFIPFTQTLVESAEARRSGAPKQIIADLFPIIADRIFGAVYEPEAEFSLASAFLAALEQKDIMLFMEDEPLQAWLEKENWAGAINSWDAPDYLHVNTAVVNGGKSEFAVRQEVRYEVFEDASGASIASVAITREHTGSASEYHDFDALVNRDNLTYIRVYAPSGSSFVGIEGNVFDPESLFQNQGETFEDDELLGTIEGSPLIDERTKTRITSEFGKTAFGNYMKVAPGEKKTVRFIYKLPFTKKDIKEQGYALVFQKQGGLMSRLVVSVFGKALYEGELKEDMIIK